MSTEITQLGEFEIIARLGQGGMGTVYKGYQTALKRFVAIKTLNPSLAADPDFVERFHNEAVAAAALNHPNLVQVFAAGESGDIHWFAMEFVDGESAQARLVKNGCLALEEAVAIALHVATALDYAWRKARIIHRDIKPDNIFISSDGDVKLGDLGLAKSTGQDSRLSLTGATVGTPLYLSPEQAEGKRDVDLRTDIYSLGCTLYHMLCGAPPYSGDSAVSVIIQHVSAPIPDSHALNPMVPESVARVISKMMQKSPGERYPDYSSLTADLHEALQAAQSEIPGNEDSPDSLLQHGRLPESHAPSRLTRPRARIIGMAVGACATAVLAGGVWIQKQKAADREREAAEKRESAQREKSKIEAEQIALKEKAEKDANSAKDAELKDALAREAAARETAAKEKMAFEEALKAARESAIREAQLKENAAKELAEKEAALKAAAAKEAEMRDTAAAKERAMNQASQPSAPETTKKEIAIAEGTLLAALQQARTDPRSRLKAENPIPLFDGVSLNGWVDFDTGNRPSNEFWSINQGILRGRSKSPQWIVHTKRFENFVLELEWRNQSDASGGVIYRVSDIKSGKSFAPQFQITGSENKDHWRTGGLVGVFNPRGIPPPVDGQWNSAFIVAIGTRCEHWVNKQMVCHYNTTDGDFQNANLHRKVTTQTSGFVGLESFGSAIEFRNLRIYPVNIK